MKLFIFMFKIHLTDRMFCECLNRQQIRMTSSCVVSSAYVETHSIREPSLYLSSVSLIRSEVNQETVMLHDSQLEGLEVSSVENNLILLAWLLPSYFLANFQVFIWWNKQLDYIPGSIILSVLLNKFALQKWWGCKWKSLQCINSQEYKEATMTRASKQEVASFILVYEGKKKKSPSDTDIFVID